MTNSFSKLLFVNVERCDDKVKIYNQYNNTNE